MYTINLSILEKWIVSCSVFDSKNLPKSHTTNGDNETENSTENEDEERESYVLTLTQKPGKMDEDDSSIPEENINSSQCFEECSQV